MSRVEAHPVLANRWVAREHIDDNTCQPCIDNDGKLYKNREDAYADYPDGKGFVNCIGAEYGNDCRGIVVKRRGGTAVTPEQLAAIKAACGVERQYFSARAFTSVEGPTRKLSFRAETLASGSGIGGSPNQLYLYDYIGGYDGVNAMDVVNALNGVTGDVDLHINSGGGSIFEGAAIYTTLTNYTGGTVRSFVDGVAASAASVVMMAGEEIEVSPAATVMVHAGSGGAYGTAKDVRALADTLDLLTETMAGIYAARAGGSVDEWLALLNSGDTWYTPQGAVEAKLATRIGGKPMPPDEPMPDASVHVSLLSSLADVFARDIEPQTPRPESPAPIDVAGIRNALKGILA